MTTCPSSAARLRSSSACARPGGRLRGRREGRQVPDGREGPRPVLDGHGLKLITGWFSGELRHGSIEREKRRIAQQLALYQVLEVPVMVYAETTDTVQAAIDTPVAARPRMPDEEFKSYGDKLTELAEWLRAAGCPMTFHHHMGTVVESEREVDLLMARTGDAVGLLFDTGHLHFAGGDVLATARRHGGRINHVHCKDIRTDVLARLKAENWSFLKGVIEGVFTVPGDGAIDYGPFAALLAEIGYRGWSGSRPSGPGQANPLEMARIGHAADKAFSDAGFAIT
jgi:inosose dehydratase